MKKPNIDFSKEGLKRFFLHHAEKVILAVALVLTGLFFWLGFSTDAFTTEAPKGLSQKAEAAHSYIVKNTSWDSLKDFRKADDTVDIRIKNSEELVNLSQLLPNYEDGLLTGIPERTLAKRDDPEIVLPTELTARTFNASILFRAASKDPDYALDDLTIAGDVVVEEETSSRGGRDREESAIGLQVPEYQKLEKNGVRPLVKKDANRAAARYVNVVTGVIDMDEQWKKYEILQDSMGYYPPRDKPNYRYLQIERMDNVTNQWTDVTKEITKYHNVFAGGFPIFTPEGTPTGKTAAPELIAPEYFDPVLSGPIPSFTQFDYTEFVNHPGANALKLRTIDNASAADPEAGEDTPDDSGLFGTGDDSKSPPAGGQAGGRRGAGGQGADKPNDGGMQVQRKGSDAIPEYTRIIKSAKKQSSHKLVRFYDILDENTKAGTTYKYRIKVWLDDPNNPAEKAVVKTDKSGRDGRNLTAGGGGGSAGLEDAGGGGGKQGGGDQGVETEETYTFVKAEDSMKLNSVRERIMKARERKFPEDLEFLNYARAAVDENGDEIWTESNSVTVGTDSRNAYVYAGGVSAPRKYKIDDKLIDAGERTVDVAVKTWQAKIDGKDVKVGVPVPGQKTEAHTSEVLEFVTDARILHPLDWTVREAKNTTIESSSMIVDVMGGDEVKEISPRTSGAALYTLKYHLPGEVLVMDIDKMTFDVQNNLRDKEDYMHSLFLDDEPSSFGGKRAPKVENDEKRDSGGRGDNPFG